ncbi:Rox3-domain-containing protein [Lophiostoma macrostomum CBS 122681]|uniref:Mediator of RNA polymerase II transcription subunit 19 n=1 Tax=Lophiostoma macrostomum CBS 122681 TaxID=1314788 RepID=A0A6A6TRT8_9PLEO|nr:Rox3-domain-containing protein [Lophiostoma macrostomum CBS 122681]
MSDHTSKRQRLTGSFSPASPPYHQAAKTSDQTKPVVHPNTPTSPPHMSLHSQSNGGPPVTATALGSDMTPPTSVTASQQFSQSAASASNPQPFPTPGSTTGMNTASHTDSDGDAMMADSADDGEGRSGNRRHSNHDRQSRQARSGAASSSRDADPAATQLFKLCQSTHPQTQPHGSQNLFALYGLNDLARSVARTDPVTGEKINKLRKSYENHIKALQIAGKPKAVKMEGVLTNPLSFPDEEYQVQRVIGKEMKTAFDAEAGGITAQFDSLMNSALAGMAPGPLPTADSARYRAYLGTDEATKPKPNTEGAPPRTVPPSVAATPNHAALGSRASRPERTGSKRSYTDVSFQGYGEGFADDVADSTGGEDDGQGGHKRRRLGFERTSHQVEVGGVRR